MDIHEILSHFEKVKKLRSGWQARCPAHDDKNPSLSIGVGTDGKIMLKCHAGCATEDILRGAGLEMTDLFPDSKRQKKEVVCEYPYRGEMGQHLYTVVRFFPKDFRVKRSDGSWGLGRTKPVLYRLPELITGKREHPVFVVAGEKDVHSLVKLGLAATTAPFGESKPWNPEYDRFFQGRRVVILPDNDEPGRKHADDVARNLVSVAQEVRVLNLPDLDEKQDVSDWLRKGHTLNELRELWRATPVYEPPTETTEHTLEKQKPVPLAMPVREFMESGPDSVEWLVPDLIPQGGLVILAARPKAGKSLLSTNLAISCTKAQAFLGRDCKRTRALILQLEDPPTLIRERLKKMSPAEGLYIRSGLLFTEEEWKALPQFITDNEIRLVVLDPLVFATGGGDENDAAKMSRFFLKLREIIFATGATVLVVHHHRKSPGEQGDQIRGSSAILGAVDLAWEIIREDEAAPTATLKVTSRLGVVEDEIIRLNVETLTWVSEGRAEDWKRAKRENEILQALESEGECNLDALEQALGVTPQNFRRELKNLVAKGLVEERKITGKGRPRLLYRLLDFSPTEHQKRDFSPTPFNENKAHDDAENGVSDFSPTPQFAENGENRTGKNSADFSPTEGLNNDFSPTPKEGKHTANKALSDFSPTEGNLGSGENGEKSSEGSEKPKASLEEMTQAVLETFPGTEIVDDLPEGAPF